MVREAISSVIDVLDVALAHNEHRKVRLDVRFDRIYLDLYLHYRGAPIELPERASDPDTLADEKVHLSRLSGSCVRLSATEVRARSKGQEH